MAPSKRKTDPPESSVKRQPVIIRPKHDENLAGEPEMKELKTAVQSGELDAKRTQQFLKENQPAAETEEKLKPYSIRMTEDIHRRLKVQAAKEGRTMAEIIMSLIKGYLELKESE